MNTAWKKRLLIFALDGALVACLIPVYLSAERILSLLNFIFPASWGAPVLSMAVGLLVASLPLFHVALVRHSYWLEGHRTTTLVHELKSPLSAIRSAAEILEDTSANADSAQRIVYFGMIERNLRRLEKFIGNMLDVARIGEGKIGLKKAPVDINALVQSVMGEFQLLAQKEGVQITAEGRAPATIPADEEKIWQVIANLLSNAIKFSRKGNVRVFLEARPRELLCSVEDQGIGIEKKDLRRIFDRFFQGRSSAIGSGLGLTIAKGWVEAHGGRIWAESEGIGKGSRVSFTLPL